MSTSIKFNSTAATNLNKCGAKALCKQHAQQATQVTAATEK